MRVKSDSFKKGTTKKNCKKTSRVAVINARTKQRSASKTLRSARKLYKYLVFVHPLINARSKSLSLSLFAFRIRYECEFFFLLGIWWVEKSSSSIFLAFEDEVLFGGSSTDRSLKKRRDEKERNTRSRSSQNKRETIINSRKNKCFERNASCATNTETRTTKP